MSREKHQLFLLFLIPPIFLEKCKSLTDQTNLNWLENENLYPSPIKKSEHMQFLPNKTKQAKIMRVWSLTSRPTNRPTRGLSFLSKLLEIGISSANYNWKLKEKYFRAVLFIYLFIPCFQVTSDDIFENNSVLDCLLHSFHVGVINEFIISVPVNRWQWVAWGIKWPNHISFNSSLNILAVII